MSIIQRTMSLFVHSVSQLVTICKNGEQIKVGKEMDDVCVVENGAMVIGEDGRITAVGTTEELRQQYKGTPFARELDCTGKSIVPGLCDGHTHACFAGDRVHEFRMKLAGATYMEVHAAGGGIGFTVQHVREAAEDTLVDLLVPRLERMARHGTTLVEVKSGYGLEAEAEMKMLRAIYKASSRTPMDIVANFCGGHSVPKGLDSTSAVRAVIEEHIPALKKQKEQGLMNPEMVDVFMEKGVFNPEESKAMLQAGKEAGLAINFHGDELHPLGAGELGAALGARAISHLEHVSEEGMKAMAKEKVVGVLLPTTAYVLRIAPPPARDLIQAHVPIALGSDFNPNAHCLSMPFVMNLACVTMRMTMNEALVASTINAAASMGRSSSHGSLEVGKQGDFVVIDSPVWEHLVYEMVDPPVEAVYKLGKKI